ncbi:hypothetical protein M5689_024878 [Euphorbia peplus]|nr:hypothetical protein M5689_024878 [Euphorbia peplus]
MEAPKEGGRSSRKNAAVLCSCGEPARLVVVPTSWVPGQRCWRCANPHVQCEFLLWHGPWVTERSNMQHNVFLQCEMTSGSDRSTEASSSSDSTAPKKQEKS